MADSTQPVSLPSSPVPPPRKRRLRRVVLWTAFLLFLLVAAAFIVAAVYFRRAQPILRARVVQTLETRYDSRVELASFGVSVIQGFEVNGGGLKLYPNHLDMQQPLFAVDKFSFRIGWRDLFHTPMPISRVYINGLQINMPPKEQRSNMPRLNKGGGSGTGKIQIVVNELLIDNATLILQTNKPGKIPLDFEISHLVLQSVGAGQPMKFHATLTNPKPVGFIDSTGNFGPYNTASPGDSPVNGSYTFSKADLNTIKGIGGILSSTGQYSGTLNHIVVDGQTDTPNFSLDVAQHPVPLHTTFHAIVDGTNGDTYLQPVDAHILNSHIVAEGDVVRAPQGGHDITLDVTVSPARIEDMLTLGVKTEPPLMTGALSMHTRFYLPPGPQSVTGRLHLQGNFIIANAHFTSEKIQGKVDELSLRGQGRPQEAKDNAQQGVLVNTASEMKGNFVLGADKLTISDLQYIVPGAHIAMNGVYSLDGNQFDFHGTARLDAKVSQMVTGWKSLLLKPVDPFFSKNGAGTEVPIQVTGTRSEPHFGLDFGRKDEQKKTAPPPPAPRNQPPAQPR